MKFKVCNSQRRCWWVWDKSRTGDTEAGAFVFDSNNPVHMDNIGSMDMVYFKKNHIVKIVTDKGN
jgi:hypothetical protein